MRKITDNVRIGLFIDGNYLLHTSNYYNYIHRQKCRLSIGKVSQFVKNIIAEDSGKDVKNCMITDSHYFRGRLNATDAAARGNQLYNDRVFDDILMSEGIHSHYLPLRNLYGKKEERGIDVWLSLEAYEIALTKGLDYVVLIISDTDYVPLVRKLTSLGIKTVLLSWEFEYINDEGQKLVTKTSQELLNIVTMPLDMHTMIEDGLCDNDSSIEDLFIPTILKNNETSIEEEIFNTPELTTNENNEGSLSQTVEVSEILSLKQGYGFIRFPNNNLFFHYHDVVGDFSLLEPNDTVEFVIGKNADGNDVAKQVKKIYPEGDEPIVTEQTEDIDLDTNTTFTAGFFDWSSNK